MEIFWIRATPTLPCLCKDWVTQTLYDKIFHITTKLCGEKKHNFFILLYIPMFIFLIRDNWDSADILKFTGFSHSFDLLFSFSFLLNPFMYLIKYLFHNSLNHLYHYWFIVKHSLFIIQHHWLFILVLILTPDLLIGNSLRLDLISY